jgi:transposase
VGRNRRKFTPEFKAEAVALVEASGGNIAAVAKELGIHDSSLGNWVRQFREQAEGAPSVEERAEIRELRRELDRVKRERDILAKAVHGRGASTGLYEIVVGRLLTSAPTGAVTPAKSMTLELAGNR